MRMAWITASALVFGALAIVGCSSSSASEPTGSVTANVQNGTVDTTHRFAVGVCGGASQPGDCRGICSGALILPNVVATARHCVSQSPERIDCRTNPSFGADKTGFYITTNPSMFSGSATTGWYKAKTVLRPNDAHICGNDIALIVLEKSVPEAEAKPVTPGIQHVMWDSRYLPSFTAIGYGRTGPASLGGNGGAGTRRILDLIDVRCVPGSETMDCPTGLNASEFVGGGGICQGDSGSSAFETTSFQNDDAVSFGVLSRGGESDDGTLCEASIYTRFDAHRDFVLDVAKTASQNWSLYPEPAWTAYVEPPPSKSSKKDAGASSPTDSNGYSTIGEECAKNKDCASGLCVEADGAKVCSKSCEDDESSCGKGYECRESVCLKVAKETTTEPTAAAAPAAPQTVTTTTSTCAFSGSSSGGSAGWLVGLGLALAAIRRRRER